MEKNFNCRKQTLTKEFDSYLRELIVSDNDSCNLNLLKSKAIEDLVKKLVLGLKFYLSSVLLTKPTVEKFTFKTAANINHRNYRTQGKPDVG